MTAAKIGHKSQITRPHLARVQVVKDPEIMDLEEQMARG